MANVIASGCPIFDLLNKKDNYELNNHHRRKQWNWL